VPPNTPGTVLFAGAAPGEVIGGVQINVLIPEDVVLPNPGFGNQISLQLGFTLSGSSGVNNNDRRSISRWTPSMFQRPLLGGPSKSTLMS
jgi:hypothetical protein